MSEPTEPTDRAVAACPPTPDACCTPWLALTTVADAAQARSLAHALLDQGVVACVQLQPIESLYLWQGRRCADPEVRLLLKTTAAQWPALQAAVQALHPYELPVLMGWPATTDSAAQGWLVAALTPGG